MSEAVVREVGDITEAKDEGVIKSILREAVNAELPAKGDTVFVHYVGRLEDGTEFDSSLTRNEPFSFKLGKGQVIKGWDIGVATMKVGEKCRLTIKSAYGYGETGSGEKIPPNATLVFDVELIQIAGEDVSEERDGSVTKRTLVEGTGYDEPNDGSAVSLRDIVIDLRSADGQSIREEAIAELDFVIGEGESHGVPEGLECAIMRMKKQERARIEIKKNRLCGLKDCPSEIEMAVYTVTMSSFDKAKESWQMDASEKIEAARTHKEKGTKFFKDGKYAHAIKRYKKAADLVRVDSYETSEISDEQGVLFVDVNNNLCLCYNKTGQYSQSIECADKVLEKDAKNEKGLFRRGEARFANGDWTEALRDFTKVLEINGSNTAAIVRIREVKHKMREYREQEKNLFAKMMKALGSGTNADKQDEEKHEHSSRFPNFPIYVGEKRESSPESCTAEKADCCGAGDCQNKEKCMDH